jgi:ABC-type multidrug transport system ATPase subunit
MSSIKESNVEPLDDTPNAVYDIEVRNLSYQVGLKSKKGESSTKQVLCGINADAYHGQIFAVVGASGSGKTTLLDALAGRIEKRSLKGTILINGGKTNASFKRISGYVMQDDALYPMLTVRETLRYGARLRLPGSMKYSDKMSRVEDMILQLGLKECADTKVGNDIIRGVSGGERRRVSIGWDLIHDPAVLFLDEPTSGLDGTSALKMLTILKEMAVNGGRTVVLTIHQPSYRLLDCIDRILVLGQGSVIFHGNLQDLKHHFDPIGHPMPEFANVVEFAVDLVLEYQQSEGGLAPLLLLEKTSQQTGLPQTTPAMSEVGTDITTITTASAIRRDERKSRPVFARNFIVECFILGDRALVNRIRTPELFIASAVALVGAGVLVGTIFLRLKRTEVGARERAAVLAFQLAALIFTAIESLGTFIGER